MEERNLEKRQEVEVVTTAYFLEDRIAKLKQDAKRLRDSKPQEPAMPQEPLYYEQKFITPTPYPKINVKVSFFEAFGIKPAICGAVLLFLFVVFDGSNSTGLAVLTGLMFFIWLIYGVLKIVGWIITGGRDGKVWKKKEEQIRNSPEYMSKCREIDEENHRRQEELDKQLRDQFMAEREKYQIALAKHKEDVKRYHDEILPAWSEEATALQTALNDTQTALQELYDRNVIPAQYRNIYALYYLATFIGTSNFGLEYAIERYDDHIARCQRQQQITLAQAQLMATREMAQNQQYAIWLNEQMAGMLEQGNETLHSINTWQKADLAIRTYWRFKDRRKQKAKNS